ncbi:MAG: hypothetical protein II712_01400, partial [Erysipelotrichaceae bacterium]|nr:hypothetical protein [Erysipelotrichaceae bacterium]
IQTVIDKMIICHHIGELRSADYRLQGKPGKIYGYPLISRINEGIRTLVSDYYGYKAASSQIEGICEILYYHIEAMKLVYGRPRIAVGCRGNEFEAKLLLETIRREVSSEYYQSIETADFISISEEGEGMNEKYDLMICDQKISADENVLALENFDFNFANIEYYLRYSRSLFAEFEKHPYFLEKRDIDFLDLPSLQKCVSEISSQLQIDEELIQNSFNYYSDINDCRVIIIPLLKKEFYLSLGEVLNKNAGKARKCLIMAAYFSKGDTRLLNTLLRELVSNARFFKAMAAERSFETANNHLNGVFR